jgi:hypothetical protein
MQITIPVDERKAPADYNRLLSQIAKWEEENDCDIIGRPIRPPHIQEMVERLEDYDTALRRCREYRVEATIHRSTEEANLYWAEGFGGLTSELDEYGCGPDRYHVGLHERKDDVSAELRKDAMRAVESIIKGGRRKSVTQQNVTVEVSLAAPKENRFDLQAHVKITVGGKEVGQARWASISTWLQAARDWADAPNEFQGFVYPLIARVIGELRA